MIGILRFLRHLWHGIFTSDDPFGKVILIVVVLALIYMRFTL